MDPSQFDVDDASSHDAAACAAIYAWYVTTTAATFQVDPPGGAVMAARIAAAQAQHAWLVLRQGGDVVGYAYGTAFRTRAAYRWTCEVSAYLHHDHTGRGGGRALCTRLLQRLTERGLRTATAGVALPNDASLALHAAMGFTTVGTFHRVGWKLGPWRDVTWLERSLAGAGGASSPPGELT